MKKIMINLAFLASLLALALCRPAGAQPAGAATGAGILLAAEKLKAALANLSPQLGFAGTAVVGAAATQLDALLGEFSRELEGKVEVPIAGLGSEVQNLARHITYGMDQLGSLLNRQRTCGFSDLENLLSGIRTVTLHLKEGVPFVDPSHPRFEYFRFDGHSASVVPAKGGQATLIGFRLWPEKEVEPLVELRDESRSAILAGLKPFRAGSQDEVGVRIPGEILDGFAGKCLYLVVNPRVKKGFLKRRIESLGAFNRAICIPGSRSLAVQTKASIRYTCPSLTRRTLEPVGFYYENNDPVNQRQVSETKTLNIPEGCRIVNITPRKESITREFINSGFSFTGTTITANAHLGDAVDFDPPIGPRVILHHAVWSFSVFPEIECRRDVPMSSPLVESTFHPLGENGVRLPLEIPKSCEFDASSFRYEVWSRFGDKESVRMFESPWLPAAQNGATHAADYEAAKVRLAAAYNPGLAGGSGQVYVEIKPAACGY